MFWKQTDVTHTHADDAFEPYEHKISTETLSKTNVNLTNLELHDVSMRYVVSEKNIIFMIAVGTYGASARILSQQFIKNIRRESDPHTAASGFKRCFFNFDCNGRWPIEGIPESPGDQWIARVVRHFRQALPLARRRAR